MAKISAKRVILTSFIVDFSDLLLNMAVAYVSGSVVMLAEALQGGADLLTSGLLLFGWKRASRRANSRYRFGYGRELFFWILMSGVVILILTSTLSFTLGLGRILNPQPIHYVGWSLIILLIGLATNFYALKLSLRRLIQPETNLSRWRRVVTSDLIETKATLILDTMGTLAAFSGLVALSITAITGDVRFDGFGSMIIGVITAVLAVLLMWEVKEMLVGKSASPEVETAIQNATKGIGGVLAVLDLKTMYLGSERLLVNIEVHLAPNLMTQDIEQLVDQIKDRVKREVPMVKHIQVELETPSDVR